jgi:integrase
MSASEPIRETKDVIALLNYFRKRHEFRNYCFLGFGFYTALKVSDLIRLKWRDVYDFDLNVFREYVIVEEKKIKRNRKVYMNEHLTRIVMDYLEWLEQSGNRISSNIFLFKSRKGDNKPITRQHAHRIIQEAAESAGISGVVSCESMRKTFGYTANKLGVSHEVIIDVYNHKSYETAKRYIGIEQEGFIEQEEFDDAQKTISLELSGKNLVS